MWRGTDTTTFWIAEFFRLALSHETLANYIQTNFGLTQHHKWSLTELEEMYPWEREIYISLLLAHLEELEMQRKQAQNK